MARRRRNASPTGVPLVTAAQALRLEVIKGVLLGTLELEQGAARMRVSCDELARLVDGARRAVIATLGESALAMA